ncbi:MAG: cobalamin biosynthesis protein [Acidobacteriaceae bacterium]|nr:cobalamin biosynthesis protein [Acidobacteriaceae bacterium]MBV8375619.1 cobalamin biosynthesis protein [Verrucomicrobiota bacterium]
MTSALGIWIVRAQAKQLGRKLEAGLGGKLCDWQIRRSNREAFSDHFRHHRQWILVMAAGIAVRYLQGLPTNKATDPGVVVLDEGCRFAVPLLCGHEGGANELAYRVANLTGAVPVITTATETLKPLIVGVGCRKGTSAEKISAIIDDALSKTSRRRAEIREIATIDLKAQESGLLEYCQRHLLPLRIIPQRLIQDRPWVTTASAWVRENAGVDGVCEPCALLATFRGKLILPKTTNDGVAIAIVEEALEL